MVTERLKVSSKASEGLSLNPYCVGLWSLSVSEYSENGFVGRVLILIVLDYGHWDMIEEGIETWETVLILIVLDYGHWELGIWGIKKLLPSLNPYCVGLWSLRMEEISESKTSEKS